MRRRNASRSTFICRNFSHDSSRLSLAALQTQFGVSESRSHMDTSVSCLPSKGRSYNFPNRIFSVVFSPHVHLWGIVIIIPYQVSACRPHKCDVFALQFLLDKLSLGQIWYLFNLTLNLSSHVTAFVTSSSFVRFRSLRQRAIAAIYTL